MDALDPPFNDPGYDPAVRALVLHAIEQAPIWQTYDMGVLTNGEALHELTVDIARCLEANHVVALPDLPETETERLRDLDGPRSFHGMGLAKDLVTDQPRSPETVALPNPTQGSTQIIEAILEILNDFEEAPNEAIADSIFQRLVELHAESRPDAPETVDPQDLHPWSELSNTGLLWLINTAVLHPRGYALGIDPENSGWRLFAAPPGECFDFLPQTAEHPEGVPLDEMFRRAEAFLASVRLEQWGDEIEPEPEGVSIAEVIEAVNSPESDDEDVEYQGDGWREIDGVDMDEADDE